jgi:hypothetical protein
MLPVDEDDDEKKAAPESGNAEPGAETVIPESQKKERAGEQLHQGDAEGNTDLAVAAPPAQPEIAQQWNQVQYGKATPAGITVRGRGKQRFVQREAVDTDIEKTSDGNTYDGKENSQGGGHIVTFCPVFRGESIALVIVVPIFLIHTHPLDPPFKQIYLSFTDWFLFERGKVLERGGWYPLSLTHSQDESERRRRKRKRGWGPLKRPVLSYNKGLPPDELGDGTIVKHGAT